MSRHLVVNLWLPVKHYEAVHNTLQAALLTNLLTGCRGSCRPGRTAALWAAGSSPAGRTDPLSPRCSPAGGGPISGRTFLQMTGKGRGGQQRWASVFKLNNWPPPFPNRPIPRCLQTRSTAGSGCCRGSWRRRRCCCRRPHTRSQGNIAGPKTYRVTSGAQNDFFCLKFMSLFPTRTGLKAENVTGRNLIPHKWLHKAHHLNLMKALIRLRFSFPFSGAKHLSFQFHFTPFIEAKAENTFKRESTCLNVEFWFRKRESIKNRKPKHLLYLPAGDTHR